MTINVLPENVLLNIFDLDRISQPEYPPWGWTKEWNRLVQVCRKWRHVIFASPLRLKLQIFCTDGTPVRKYLDIWPTHPILVKFGYPWMGISPDDEDDVIAAFEHPVRLCQVFLDTKGEPQFGKIVTMMQEPCPMLTCLSLFSIGNNVPVLPGGFLGGSASHLEKIRLTGVSFPELPTLLLSAINLIELILYDIPPTAYISPEAMVTHLAALSRLTTLRISFRAVTPHSDQIILPPSPLTRTILPALLELYFFGVCEYLEDFVARIDTPQLAFTTICYCDLDIHCEVPQLSEFLNRSEYFKKTLSNNCEVSLGNDEIFFTIFAATTDKKCRVYNAGISFHVTSESQDRSISHLNHLLDCISLIRSDIVHLSFDISIALFGGFLDDIKWSQLFSPFTSVQTLYVPGEIARLVSYELEDMAEEMVTEVLPALELLCLEDQAVSSVDRFVTLRQDSGLPVTVVETSEDFHQRLQSYP